MAESWWCLARVLIILLGLPTATEANTCASFNPDEDIFLRRGQPLELRCTAETCNANISVYNWRIEMIHGRTGARRNFTNNSTNSNEKELALYFPEISFEDNGTYFCYLNGKLQGLKLVQIGDMPEPPKSIKCVSLNWTKMTCYVELSQKETDIPTRWTMEYKYESKKDTFPCAKYNASYLNCGTIAMSKHENYTITVTGINEEYNITFQNRTYMFTDICCIVKPNPVDGLTYIKTEDSSAVNLTWKFPRLLPHYINMTYRIYVKSVEGWDNRILVIKNIFTQREYTHIYEHTVKDLIPFAIYNISVSAKPVRAVGELYWSEPAVVTFRTDPDVTGHSTSFVEGSYYAQGCGEYYICPVVYWKNPERRYSHGLITGYQLNISQIDKLAVESLSSTLEPDSHKAVAWEVRGIMVYSEDDLRQIKTMTLTGRRVYDVSEFKFLKNKSYLVQMRVGNEAGFTDSVSELLIPASNKAEKLRPHRVIVEVDDRDKNSYSAVISWQMTLNITCEEELQETVYWCTVGKNEGNKSYALCEDDFNWQIVPSTNGCSNSMQKISLPYGVHADSIRFGVSVGVGGVSGGIAWEACRFDAMFEAPDVPLYRVDPVQDKHDELKVTVLYENCYSREGGRPVKYQVVYQLIDGKRNYSKCPEGADLVSFPVNFDQPYMYLDNLVAGTQYVVCLRAVSDYSTGNYGKPKVMKTSAPEPDELPVVWIVLGSVVAVIILVLLIVCCVRYWKVKLRMVKIDVPDIHVPRDAKYQNGIAAVHYIKDGDRRDSGMFTSSTPVSSNSSDKRASVIDSHSGENSESTEPILAQQITSTVSNTESPSPERRRKISLSLPGYQRFIPDMADNFYDECERSSLIENEGGENGVDNDLDIDRVAVEKITRPEHISVDIEEPEEIMDKVLENKLDVVINCTAQESIASEVVPGLVKENKLINIEASRTEENGTNIKNTIGDNMKSSEYVDEDEMGKLGKRTICENFPHLKIPDRKKGEWRAPEVFDKNSTNMPLRSLKSGTDSPDLKAVGTDIDSKLKNKNQEQSKTDNAGKSHSSLNDIMTSVKELNTTDVNENRDRKTTGSNAKRYIPNGITFQQSYKDNEYVDSANALNVDNDTKPQNGNKMVDKMEDRKNAVITEIHDTDADEHKNDSENLSDIDDRETEDMFNPPFGYGDGELTDIFEAVEANHGYAGADQISIGSYQSNASSLQEQSESRVGSNRSSNRSSTTTSPWHNDKQKEVQNGNLEAELKILSGTLESLNKSIDGTEENLLKAVGEEVRSNGIINRNFQDDINNTMFSGNSSGSGISSYVALGKIFKDNNYSQAEIDKDGLGIAAEQSKEDGSTENKFKVKEILILKERERDSSKEERSADDSDIELTHL